MQHSRITPKPISIKYWTRLQSIEIGKNNFRGIFSCTIPNGSFEDRLKRKIASAVTSTAWKILGERVGPLKTLNWSQSNIDITIAIISTICKLMYYYIRIENDFGNEHFTRFRRSGGVIGRYIECAKAQRFQALPLVHQIWIVDCYRFSLLVFTWLLRCNVCFMCSFHLICGCVRLFGQGNPLPATSNNNNEDGTMKIDETNKNNKNNKSNNNTNHRSSSNLLYWKWSNENDIGKGRWIKKKNNRR